MNGLLLWAVLLVFQAAAFTWVSRARNSGSVTHHSFATVLGCGIFFANIMLIGLVAYGGKTSGELLVLGLIYVASTVAGAVLMHIVSPRWLESGKRRVGA